MTHHTEDEHNPRRPQPVPPKKVATKSEGTPKKSQVQPKVPMTNMSRKEYVKVRARQKKKLFNELRALGNVQGWKSFAGSCLGTLAGLIIFCLFCSFMTLFTSRGKPQVADTKVKTVSSPKKTATPQPKAEATQEEQTTEPEPAPNVAEELPPPEATQEEPEAPAEQVILKIIADEEIGFLGLKGDKGPPGVPVSLFYGKEVIAQTKIGKKGTFNFYFDTPQLVPKGGVLEARCTLLADQKVSATLSAAIFKDAEGTQKEVKPTYKKEDDSFHVKLQQPSPAI